MYVVAETEYHAPLIACISFVLCFCVYANFSCTACYQMFKWGDWKRKYGKRKYRRMEYASTEYVRTNMQGGKRKYGKRKYESATVENVSTAT